MRLLNVHTGVLEEFFREIPDYAILSHRWTEEEASFDQCSMIRTGPQWMNSILDESAESSDPTTTPSSDIKITGIGQLDAMKEQLMLVQQELEYIKKRTCPKAPTKVGWEKIINACRQARNDGYNYLWADTCSIDKSSSSELSEAINSMFQWYQCSKICYVYLNDVELVADISKSQWFTRAWTLQELLAPETVVFFSKDWTCLGSKIDLVDVICAQTRISEQILQNPEEIWSQSISMRMAWAANRKSTRLEDIAYSLLGIFRLNMAMLYGEGERAFERLQEEIIKMSDDQTIFLWQTSEERETALARSPSDFLDAADVCRVPSGPGLYPYALTQRGLQMQLAILNIAWSDGQPVWAGLTGCQIPGDYSRQCIIYMKKADGDEASYIRCQYKGNYFGFIDMAMTQQAKVLSLYFPVRRQPTSSRQAYCRLILDPFLGQEFSVKYSQPKDIEVYRIQQHDRAPTFRIIRSASAASNHDLAARFVFVNLRETDGFVIALYFWFRRLDLTNISRIRIYPRPRDLPFREWLHTSLAEASVGHVLDTCPTGMRQDGTQDSFEPGTLEDTSCGITAELQQETVLNQKIYLLKVRAVFQSESLSTHAICKIQGTSKRLKEHLKRSGKSKSLVLHDASNDAERHADSQRREYEKMQD